MSPEVIHRIIERFDAIDVDALPPSEACEALSASLCEMAEATADAAVLEVQRQLGTTSQGSARVQWLIDHATEVACGNLGGMIRQHLDANLSQHLTASQLVSLEQSAVAAFRARFRHVIAAVHQESRG